MTSIFCYDYLILEINNLWLGRLLGRLLGTLSDILLDILLGILLGTILDVDKMI